MEYLFLKLFSDKMTQYNRSYTKLKKVEAAIADGTLETHAVRKRDKAKFKADTYNVFHLVYDQDRNVVQHFYKCNVCKILFKMDLNGGTHQMKRHPCFKSWELKRNAEEKEAKRLAKIHDDSSEDDDESSSSDGSDEDTGQIDDNINVKLSKLITDLSKICTEKGLMKKEDAGKVARKKWKPEEWFVDSFFFFS